MRCNFAFLQQAEDDIKELKNYIISNFSQDIWKLTYEKIKKAVNSLKIFPQTGSVLPELENLGMNQYRQIISDANRIIYEIRQDMIYIHIICDTRREMKSLLMTRLLSAQQ